MALTKVKLIANNSATAAIIAENTVGSSEIAQNSVTSVQIPNNSLGTTQVSAAMMATKQNSLTSGDITSAMIANNSVTIAKLAVTDGTSGQVLKTDGSGTLSFGTSTSTTINNNANNRLITGSGTANTLEGEATLVYTGTNLGVGTGNPTTHLHVGDSTDNNTWIQTASSAGNYSGIKLTRGAGDYSGVGFENNNLGLIVSDIGISMSKFTAPGSNVTGRADYLTVDNSGNVAIGVGTTTNKLHVAGKGFFGPVGTGQGDSKANMGTNAVLQLTPHSTNSTNMTFAQVASGNGMGIQVSNSNQTANWDIALNPFGGRVGIGTDAPGAALDVNTGTVNTLAHFHSTDDNAFIELKDDDTTGYIGVQNDYLYIGGAPSTNAQNLVIKDGEARVGIGVTSPAGPLHVRSALNETMIADYTYADGTGSFTWQSFRRNNTNQYRIFGTLTANQSLWGIYNDQNGGTFPLVITHDDRMGFGGAGGSSGVQAGAKFHFKGGHMFIEDSNISTGDSNGVPQLTINDRKGIHFYSSASGSTEGLTFSTPSNGVQAGIVCHNNNSDGTHLGFFTTNSYAAGPRCRWKITNYGTLIGGTNINIASTTANNVNAIQVDAGDITVTAANNGVSLTDLLPGYTRGDYGAFKSSANYIYFVIGNSYVSNINTSGTYGASDLRLKTNVSTISGALDKVNQLRGVNFEWKDEDRGTGNNLGFIAQEMETVIPELVNEAGLPNDENGEAPIKSVNYANLTSVLVEAIKELSAKNDALEERIKVLEG